MRTPRISPVFATCLLITFLATTRVGADEQPKDTAPARPAAIVPQPVKIEKLDAPPLVFDIEALRGIGQAVGKEPGPLTSNSDLIVFKINSEIGQGRPDWQAAESYTLTADSAKKEVVIVASSQHGLFNGVQTLSQLLDKGPDGKWRVPAVKIEDFPRFAWRGYLLDPARHFRPKAEVLRYIDLLAMHKMNVFHLHLTDDQGWRVEIKRYPKLIEVGSHLPNVSGQTGEGWYYSQADIKEIVAYAADRFVTVVPEIEMPGHSGAATTSYPELSCDGKPSSELCVGKESTYEFMANVLDEVVDLFPSKFVHIGGDEVSPNHWRNCPVCKKRMDELMKNELPENVQVHRLTAQGFGLPPNADVSRLEGDFLRRIDHHLAEKGRRMIGWDEILESGLDKDSHAAVMAWRNDSAITAALEAQRDMVASVCPNCYLDYAIPLEVQYAVEPAAANLPETKAKLVLGVQGNMWGERTPTQDTVDRQTFPRLCALAEIGWTPLAARDFKDFSTRMERHAERMQPYGISLAPKAGQ